MTKEPNWEVLFKAAVGSGVWSRCLPFCSSPKIYLFYIQFSYFTFVVTIWKKLKSYAKKSLKKVRTESRYTSHSTTSETVKFIIFANGSIHNSAGKWCLKWQKKMDLEQQVLISVAFSFQFVQIQISNPKVFSKHSQSRNKKKTKTLAHLSFNSCACIAVKINISLAK